MRLPLLVMLAAGMALAPSSAEAAFPGANGKIAFGRAAGTGERDIFSMNADGSGQLDLTNSSVFETDPAFSADGTKIAFTADADPGPPPNQNDIFVMNADGTGVTNVTMDPSGEGNASLSPNGQQIAFIRVLTGPTNAEVFVTNSDGSGTPTNLTNDPANDAFPTFSPDGQKIAFARDLSGDFNADEIFVMNADGTGQANLTMDAAAETNPDFSPNGQKIAFTRDMGADGIPDEVLVMNADGTGQTNLTQNGALDTAPAFSPDGQQIAFTRDTNGDPSPDEIFVMNADGSSQHNVTQSGAADFDGAPSWQPVAQTSSPPVDTTPPDTTITEQPKNRLDSHRATYEFTSTEPGSTFLCKRDNKSLAPCSSPQKLKKLDEGKHKFSVQAVDPAGNADPTAATDQFKVID